MGNILSRALVLLKTELDSLPLHSFQYEETRGSKGEGAKTMALLEQYSELLLKSVEKKLDTKT